MPIISEHSEISLRDPERRLHTRRRVGSLATIDLGRDNRAIVSNLSEGGLAVEAAVSQIEVHNVGMRFCLPESKNCVEINGHIAWLSESRKEAGIRFLNLPRTTSTKIQRWILLESSRANSRDEKMTTLKGPLRSTLLQSPHILEISLDHDWSNFRKSWKECNNHFPDHTIHCDPDWIEEHFKTERKNLRIFFLERGEEVVGAVPFVLHQEHLTCQLGEFTVAKFPMSVLRLQGYTPNIPAEEATLDLLFGQILRSDFDAIQMHHVRTESFLWSYLRNSALIRRSFSFYSRRGALPHLLIRLDGTFESYMTKFSAQTRKNRLREIKILRKLGDVQLVRVTSASQIDEFLEAAYAVSRKARQFDRLGGWGIAARDRAQMRNELRFLADRGWLRSYLLKCGGAPCSFILGQHYGPRFYADTVGTDRAWRNYSVGTVLLLLVLEDLFKENPPQFYDFGSHVKWQEYFANESYPEASVWLFRRQAYPLLASSVYRTCSGISLTTGAALDWLRLKSRVKQILEWR